MTDQEIRLKFGEMNAGEMRLARALVAWHEREIAALKDELAALPERPQAQPVPWPGQQEAIDKAFEEVRAAHLVTPKTGDEYAPARLAIAQAYDAARPQAAAIAALKAELEQTRLEYSELKRRLQAADERAEKAHAELAALRQPILADDGKSLESVYVDAFNTHWQANQKPGSRMAGIQAVAAVVEARMIRRMEAVPKEEIWKVYKDDPHHFAQEALEAVRARLIAAAKGEAQPVVVNEPPKDEKQPDLSGESDKQDPYAELKAAHAAGKIIQMKLNNEPDDTWDDIPDPGWGLDPDEYRIKPEPTQPTTSPSWTPAVGDTVRLKSGGPVMTVTDVDPLSLMCAWMNTSNELQVEPITTLCLEPAQP